VNHVLKSIVLKVRETQFDQEIHTERLNLCTITDKCTDRYSSINHTFSILTGGHTDMSSILADQYIAPTYAAQRNKEQKRGKKRGIAITDVSAAGELEGRSNSNIRKKGSRLFCSYPSSINW
jgi:hypothetical protein